MPTRRTFLKMSVASMAAAFAARYKWIRALAAIPGGDLDPTLVPKYQMPLVKPPIFPKKGRITYRGMKNGDYYELAVRQFQQQVLPPGMPMTTVWSYGPLDDPRTVAQGGRYFFPAFTLESRWRQPTVVKWVNGLVDANGGYLPHLLPVDQTLHWANPGGGMAGRDGHGMDSSPYTGPVPMVVHVHGAHVTEDSDGHANGWWLPAANNIPAGYAETGTYYDYFNSKYNLGWTRGSSIYRYANDQRATTLWYHDHSMGMTRLNVYAGPAGFYLLRGGPDDLVLDSRTLLRAVLPGPAPTQTLNPFATVYEIPIAIQDRSFNANGSLFYPDNRAFFEGLDKAQLQIPFHPDMTPDGQMSDIAPIWNPEFFGNTMVVNGQTWPFLDVEQRRYRLRLLNGCNSRFLILKFDHPGVQVWQIGTEGGFLPAPVDINAVTGGTVLMGLAERADLIVDFTNVAVGTTVTLLNLGPDEPYGGGVPGNGENGTFASADPATTGQVMEFRVGPALSVDLSTPPQFLQFPAVLPLAPTATRPLSLNEMESETVFASEDESGNVVFDPGGAAFAPESALLGKLEADNFSTPMAFGAPISENPALGATETWEFYNFTADAHPMHIHQVMFQVVNREGLATDAEGMSTQPAQLLGNVRPPEAWETGFKDTVICYPGEVTRVNARFDLPGEYVWHCHIVEHEDNEMMRPFSVG